MNLTRNQRERFAMLLRGYAHSRGAPVREDDESAALTAVLEIVATLERTPA